MNTVILMVALLTQAEAPDAGGKVRPVVERVADPYDAVGWAVQDAIALRKSGGAHGCFYVWIGPDERAEIAKANSLVVNSSLSHAETIVLPELTARGRLLRWDTKRLCPNPHDHARLVGVLNSLAKGEPFWHVDLKAAGFAPQTVPAFKWIDGKTYTATSTALQPETGKMYAMLQQETGLFCPLVRADYLLRKISSTIQGGVYYHARGFITFDAHGNQKRLNETEIFALFGNDVKLSRKVGGDDRVGITISGITGQARAIEFGQGAIGGWRRSIDRFSDNENLRFHPLYNLLTIVDRADGNETIFELPNGLLAYILTDGQGRLVDEAPNKLVTDHRTPVPHPAQLFPPLSCARCHGPDGGVKECRNDVPKLLKDSDELDAFADFGDLKLTREEAVDRIAALYSGDFAVRVREAKTRYADACFRATRGMTPQAAAAEWARQYEAYWQTPVNAERQLLDLGWGKPRSPQAVTGMLRRLQAKPEVDALVDSQPVTQLDPLIPAPRKGIAIRRQDQERTFAEQFRRAFPHRTESLEVAP